MKYAKDASKYTCLKCYFTSNNKTDYTRHINTNKHKTLHNDDQNTENIVCRQFICECGKRYTYKQGLCVHRKVCKYVKKGDSKMTPKNSEMTPEDSAYTCEFCGDILSKNSNLRRHYTRCKMKKEIETLKKQKKDLQDLVINTLQSQIAKKDEQLGKKDEQLGKKDEQINELLPKVGNGNVTFNINNFLNEQCKDAMSLEAFVEGIKISLDQLLLTKNEGITSGISNLITENMNKLPIHERPIHCSDKKREVLYIKNETWEKDTSKNDTKHMINKLCNKQLKSVNELVHDDDDEYVEIIGKCVLNVDEKKVMKNICDSVYVKDT